MSLDTLADNYLKVAYTSAFNMDKIIGSDSGTISIAAPTAGNNLLTETVEIVTGFDDYFYYKGIWSSDGGTTWNDLGVNIPDLSVPSMPVLQTVEAYGLVTSTGKMAIAVNNYYNLVAGTGTARTVLFKVLYFSQNLQGAITPHAVPNITNFTSVERQYQKIALQGEVRFDLTPAVGSSVSIPHNLG